MAKPRVQPPPSASSSPDSATKKAIKDFTAKEADERVLFINFGFFKYGTSDKAHAAAVVISSVLLIMIILVIAVGSFMDHDWRDSAFKWLTGTFLFTAGIALGQSGGTPKKEGSSEE